MSFETEWKLADLVKRTVKMLVFICDHVRLYRSNIREFLAMCEESTLFRMI